MGKPLTEAEQQAGGRDRGIRSRCLVLVQNKNRLLCLRVIEESLDIDLAYGTDLVSMILSASEYQRNREYATPFYRNVEREGVSL